MVALRRYMHGPTLWLVVLLAGGIAALLIVGAAVLAKRHAATSDDQSRPHPDSTSQDWIEAVCKRGTYQNGRGNNVLAGATGSAMCYGKSSGTIFVGTYESQFRFDNDAASFLRRGAYATLGDDRGRLWVFYCPNGSASLSALSQYGFTLRGA